MSTEKFNGFETKILLVEDSPSDAELIMMELKENFGNVVFQRVDNDEDLKEALIEYDPDIVLSDYTMPGYSGKEALSICKTLKPDTPLIFVSGTIGEERAVDALKKGASDYVLKDSLVRLPHAIKTVLEKDKERKEVQKKQNELKRTYQLLNTIFDATHMMVAYIDNQYNFIKVNDAFAKLYNKEKSDFLGANFFAFFSKSKYEPIFNRVLSTGEPFYKYTDKINIKLVESNPIVYLDWSVTSTESFGNEGGLIITAVDVSERVKYETEALENEKSFYDALNQAPDATIIINKKGNIEFFNKKSEIYFGFSHSEIKGQNIIQLIPERYHEAFINTSNEDYVETVKNIHPNLLNHLHAKRIDGSEFPIEITAGPVRWNNKNAVIVMIRDITDKKIKENELKKLSIVASKINNAVFIGDNELNPIWVNDAFTQQTGYELEELDEPVHHKIFPNYNNTVEKLKERLNKGEHVHLEVELTKKNRTQYWAGIHISPVEDYNGKLTQTIAIITNITNRKLAEIERDRVLKTLEERVKDRTAELQEVLDQLKTKNKDIEDSIKYARNIQEAFTPPLTPTNINAHQTFVVNLPKDILSGDFHWHYTSESKNCSYIALGDCTGHGVPGSLMTILSVQLLEQRLIGKNEKRNPADVLHEIDSSIIRFLGQDVSKLSNDGLEIVLIRIDHKENMITFSGAGRPLYFIHNNQLERFRFSKFSVGGTDSGMQKNFDEVSFTYNRGDRIYSYSDGYPDQFGGPKNKKFSRKRVEDLLKEIQSEPFDQHGPILKDTIERWQGNYTQIDDIIFLGVEL